jgi:type II secretory pathway pseudopilin PulG
VLIVVLVILAAAITGFYFLGKRAQKRQEENQAQIDAMKQTVSMLIIDKKRMRMKDAGLPQAVMDSANRMMKISKLPIVKAKVGPQVMTLVCDEKIFDSIPVKKEVKATVSGIYITSVKGLHGKTVQPETKKKSWWKRTVEAAQEKAGAKAVK